MVSQQQMEISHMLKTLALSALALAFVVAIPFRELKVSTRDGKDWLLLNRTKDELKSAPAYDKKAEMK